MGAGNGLWPHQSLWFRGFPVLAVCVRARQALCRCTCIPLPKRYDVGCCLETAPAFTGHQRSYRKVSLPLEAPTVIPRDRT